MQHKSALAIICLLALAGCNRGGPSGGLMERMVADKAVPENGSFSFTHFWNFEMPRPSIPLRFERTRDACLKYKAMNCKLVSANMSTGDYPSASLEILLPHDRVDGFRKTVLAPVAGENVDDVKLRASGTRTDNVDTQSAGAARTVEQLTAYRDRLVALSKRPGLSIDDTIKLEAEISRVQGELDDAVSAKADVDGRVTRETVNISLGGQPPGAIAEVGRRASDILVSNTANALEFLIGVIPWLPIIAAAIALGYWLLRLLRRRKTAT